MALPPPSENQKYVTISPFAAGHITLPEYVFYAPSDPSAKVFVPSMSFLVQHPKASLFGQGDGASFRMLFDLGVRSEPTRYVPVLQKHIKSRSPIQHRPSALDTLESGGFEADDIDAIAISHVHWDHHGDPEDFPNTTFLLGPGAKKVLREGLPGTGNHSVFDPNLYRDKKVIEFGQLPGAAKTRDTRNRCCPSDIASNGTNGTNGRMGLNGMTHTNGNGYVVGNINGMIGHTNGIQLASPINGHKSDSQSVDQSSAWKPLGPFPHTLDLVGDGSIYVVSAPGHLPGHINLLCRISPTKWIYLGGDTFHDRHMLTGEKWITTYPDESGNGRTCCIHIDKEAAQQSLERVAELLRTAEHEDYEVEPVVAHDVVWWKENQHRLFPNML
ncbi:hypothetical protein MMC21_007824 [Puttea exsequens]|nr:hypothetical protein [Puttea exsequens]